MPLARGVPPPKQLAGGSSDTHNNHNNGISRVTRGPPPRIGPAPGTAHVTPSCRGEHWLAARRERSHDGLPSLGSTAGPLRSQTANRQDSGPSFRAELRPRNVHTTLPATRGPRGIRQQPPGVSISRSPGSSTTSTTLVSAARIPRILDRTSRRCTRDPGWRRRRRC